MRGVNVGKEFMVGRVLRCWGDMGLHNVFTKVETGERGDTRSSQRLKWEGLFLKQTEGVRDASVNWQRFGVEAP